MKPGEEMRDKIAEILYKSIYPDEKTSEMEKYADKILVNMVLTQADEILALFPSLEHDTRYVQSIFLVCHMTKLQADKEPDTENLRDSGMIGCEADNVMFIWRKKSKPQEAILKISKARRTGVMQEKIELVKVGNYLEELSYRREAKE